MLTCAALNRVLTCAALSRVLTCAALNRVLTCAALNRALTGAAVSLVLPAASDVTAMLPCSGPLSHSTGSRGVESASADSRIAGSRIRGSGIASLTLTGGRTFVPAEARASRLCVAPGLLVARLLVGRLVTGLRGTVGP